MMTAQESLSLCRLLKDLAERLLLRLPETPIPLNPICPLTPLRIKPSRYLCHTFVSSTC
jgi:hypothetical protein